MCRRVPNLLFVARFNVVGTEEQAIPSVATDDFMKLSAILICRHTKVVIYFYFKNQLGLYFDMWSSRVTTGTLWGIPLYRCFTTSIEKNK